MEEEAADNILKAAKMTGFNIYIEKEALDRLGRVISGHIGVYTKDIYKEHEPFWKAYAALKVKHD